MRQVTAVIIAFIATSCASSICAGVGERLIRFPVDSSDTSAVKDDSNKTTIQPPTFRLNNPKADKAGPSAKPAGEKRIFPLLAPGKGITCVGLSAGIGTGVTCGPEILASRCITRNYAVGLGGGVGFPSNGNVGGRLFGQMRVYPAPQVVQYYFFVDMGMSVFAGENERDKSKHGPAGCIGIGILSKAYMPPVVFIDAGYQGGHFNNHGQGESRSAVFFRGGFAF